MSFDPENVAVLTGDIVKSGGLGLPEREVLFAALKAGAETIAQMQDSPTHFERFSGDSWQLLLLHPKLALRACLLLRAYIRQDSKTFETRISVGAGAIEPLSPEGLGASDGPAFQASGRGLRALPAGRCFTINSRHNPAFVLADHISQGWSQKQAAVLTKSLQFAPPSQQAIARTLKISQQAVAKRLKSSGYMALAAALEDIESNNL